MDGSQKARGALTQTALDDTEGRTPRWRTPIVAVVTVLALLFSVLVPAGAASAATNLPELVWSQSSSSRATASLPGNFSSLPGATITVSSSKQQMSLGDSNRTVSTASAVNTSTAPCVSGKSRYQINTCDTYTYTVNFGQPVVDPVVPFALQSSTYYSVSEATSKGCILGWTDTTLSSINGRGATANDFSTLTEPSGSYVHSSPTSWTVSQSTVNSNSCSPVGGGSGAALQLKGAIQSFSFTLYQRNAIIIPWTSTFCPLMAAPAAFGIRVLVPVTDLSVTKSAPATADPNGTISWSIAVTNAGSMDSHGFVVKDAVPTNVTNAQLASAPEGCTLSGRDLVCSIVPPGCSATPDASASTVADLSCADSTAAHQTVLAPGQTSTPIVLTATAPTGVGTTITNTATVSGVDIDSNTGNNTSTAVTTVVQSAKLTIAKQAALAPGATGKAGDTVNYSFTATNTGNVTLTGVTIADPLPGLSGLSYAWPGAAGVLQAGQSVTATATYRLTQADVDAGAVSNVATATGKAPDNSTVDGGRAPATVTLNPKAALNVTKNGALAAGAAGVAGDTITYTFSATNLGDVTLHDVAITDPHAGLSPLSYQWPGAAGVLTPGQKVTATATYTITQADIDAGVVNNTASSTGTTPGGAAVDGGKASVSIPLSPRPALSITKTAKLAAGATGVVGDKVEYTFVATNIGNQTLSNVSVQDQLAGMSALTYQWPGTPGILTPGQSVTATATYAVAQKDVDSGSVNNVATATSIAPNGSPVNAGPAQATVPLSVAPELTLTKNAALAAGSSGVAGDTVQYSFTVINTGRITVSGTAITDKLPGMSALTYQWPGAPGVLLPGERATATATYTLTQADIDAGAVSNIATANGRTPNGDPVNSNDAQATVTLDTRGALTITKAAALASGQAGQAGDTVNYTFASTNTGPITLTNVAITDPLPGMSSLTYVWPGTPGTLAPGQKVTATATYTVTQADVSAGSIANTASSAGTTLTGSPVDGGKASATVQLGQTPALHLVKRVASTTGGQAGDVVTYTFTVTNTGARTLRNVVVVDPLDGLSPMSYQWPGATGVLATGETVVATATYVIKQSDVDAGGIWNTAIAHGDSVARSEVDSNESSAEVPLGAAGKLALNKTAALHTGATGAIGDVVDYTFTIKNVGGLTLSSVTVADQLAGMTAPVYQWPGTAGVLAPNQQATATASYTLTQADLDAGSVANTATATGTQPNGDPATSDPANAVVPLTSTPKLTLTKTGALASGATGKAGDVIQYSFSVKNSGNVTVSAVSISDQLPGITGIVYTWPASPGVLKPNQTATATASYTVKQSDVDAGAVTNLATVAGTDPSGKPVTDGPAQATVPLAQDAKLSLTKTAVLGAGATGVAGDNITYTFTAQNTGQTTLRNVTIADPLGGLSELSYSWPGTLGTLAPGQKVTASATYTVTQADADAGKVDNVATATGITPSGSSVPSNPAAATVPLSAAPGLAITKSGSLAAGATGRTGDTVNFSFTITNTGAVTVSGVQIADQLSGVSAITYRWPTTAGVLKPGQVATATATYTLTQADVDAATVKNIATVSGTAPDGSPVDGGPAQVEVPLPGAPSIALTKTGALAAGAAGAAGDRVDFTFQVTNTGVTTLTGVTIEDQLPGVSAITYTWPAAAGVLAPSQKATATATYSLTQADVDAGSVTNVAVPHATAPNGSPVDGAPAQAKVPVAPKPALTLAKTGALAAGATGKAGDTVNFTFTVTNSGNVTATGVSIADQLPGVSALTYAWPSVVGLLAPGQSATATATYTLTQADIDAGSVVNVATATGKAPDGSTIPSDPAQATVPLDGKPALTLEKTGALASGATGIAGDTVNFTFAVSNSGAQTVTGVSIADQLPGLSAITYTWPGAVGTLAPGQEATATATYALTQADVDAGSVKNVATATGKDPSGSNVDAPPAEVVVPVGGAPSLALTKTGALATGATGRTGDTVDFSFTITNTGAVTTKNVSIDDQLVGLSSITYAWPGAAGTLAPGQKATATATYSLTQADLDAGSVRNVATATGTAPDGTAVQAPPAEAVVPLDGKPALALVKTGALAPGSTGKSGDTVNFSFTVTNTGAKTATGVSIDDQLTGLSEIAYTWPGTAGTLAPGQKVMATATYTLTQADVDAGSVKIVATATGTNPDGSTVVTPPSEVEVPLDGKPAIALQKTGALAAGASGKAGDTVDFSFTITNTGDVTATGVTIADQLAGLSTITYTWPAAAAVLSPGQQATATATYTLQQADVDAGSVVNVATATGKAPDGSTIPSGPAQVTVPLDGKPALTLVKTGALAGGATGKAGDTVNFSFTVTNSGAQTATGVSIVDQLTGLSSITYAWPGAAGTLAPGQEATATATYTLTQADVDAGSVKNVATATGKDPEGSTVDSPPSEAEVPLDGTPALVLVKTGALAAGATGKAGDTVDFSFTVTNNGATTATSVSIADELAGLSAITYTWPGAAGTLAPGQTATATATYTLTQADVDAGSVKNVATATGTNPDGSNVDTPPSEAEVPLDAKPALTLVKTGALASGASGKAGDAVNFSFTITNTGATTATDVSIADQLTGLSAITYTWPGAAGTLAPGQKATATATYILKQSDVDAGSVTNIATATGKNPDGSSVHTTPAETTVPLDGKPALTLVKTGALAAGATGKAGDTVNFAFTVTNTGATTTTAVSIADQLSGLSGITYVWPGAAGTLAPGQSATATATYMLKQSDVDAGSVKNVATATGENPDGSNVDAPPAETTVPLDGKPALTLVKTGALASGATGAAGDAVNFSFTITNAGATTATGVSIADQLPGLSGITYVWPGATGTLTPGQSATATAAYILKQSDVDAGSVTNIATATGKNPDGSNVDAPPAEAEVPLNASPALALVKTGELAAGATGKAGDAVNFSFTVTNTGTTTATDVSIADQLTGLSEIAYTWPGATGTLAPGQKATATATYTLTQADVDAGSVKNVATATGTNPDGSNVDTTPSEAEVPLDGKPALTLVKTGALTAGATGKAGDTVTFSFAVTNTGTTTATAVSIADQLTGLSTIAYTWPGAAGTLAPGQEATATATYTLKQSDVDAGSVTNIATATGKNPDGSNVDTGPAETTVPLDGKPALTLVKTGALALGATGTAGDAVNFSFTITNTGTTTATAVAIADQLSGLSAIAYTWPGAAGTLTPGQEATATATYTLKQSDVDAGSVTNIATATGENPDGSSVETPPAEATVPLDGKPALTLVKTGALAAGATGTAGDVVHFALEVTNTGSTTATNVSIADQLTGLSEIAYTWPGAAGTLAPGQTVTATATYLLTQADVDAGSVKNVATATGTNPDGSNVDAPPAEVIVPLDAKPALDLVKTGALSADATGKAGDMVDFSFTVTNTGATTATSVSIDDELEGLSEIAYTWPGAVGTLSPGQTVTATATYALTQADVDAGSVKNVAIARGHNPDGSNLETPPAEVAVPVAPAPALSLAKTGALAAGATGKAGDTVTFGFTVTNTGSVTATGVTIDDQLADLSTIDYVWPGAAGALAPGQSATATATYTLTQADVDAGRVQNVATATGQAPDGSNVDAPPAEVVVPVVGTSALAIIKTGALAPGATGKAGDTVDYTFTATNTGTVTLTGVTISDRLAGLSAVAYSWPGEAGTLAPGQSVTATASYTLKQADVDAGSVVNVATATGTDPDGDLVPSDPVTAVVPLTPAPGLSLVKKGGLVAGAKGVAGDRVEYTFTVTNTGTVTESDITIEDQLAGLSGIAYTWPGAAGVLAPGQVVTATASYVLTQADVDAGSVANTALATGETPDGETVPSGPGESVVPLDPAPGLSVVKKAALAAGATGAAGDVVTYTFTMTNSGGVTLSSVTVADRLAGLSSPVYSWPAEVGVLAPGQSATATATYTVTQADVDAGSVGNVATATGTTPEGETTDAPPAEAVVPLNPAPGLSVVKAAALAKPGEGAAGDAVNYTFSVTNTGGVTISGVSIADRLVGLSGIEYTWPGAASVLAPGQTATATATYTITTADVAAGSVSNVAFAKGRTPGGGDVTAPDAPATVALPHVEVSSSGEPGIGITKSGSLAPGSLGQVGDQVLFTLVVTNTGAVPLDSVSISDPLPGISPIAFSSWPGAPGHLEPGQSVTATATYALTAEDVARGAVENTAWAHGTGGGREVGGGSNTVSVPVPQRLTSTDVPGLGTALARTGQDALPIGLGAIGLLLAGGLVLMLRRRRPQES